MNILTIKATAYDTISELLATDSEYKEVIDGIVFMTDRLIRVQMDMDAHYDALMGVYNDSENDTDNSTDEPTEPITDDSETSDDAWDELKEAEEQTMKEVVPDQRKKSKPCEVKPLPKDIGKVMALTEAGWSASKIADEFRTTPQVIYNWRHEYRKTKSTIEGKYETKQKILLLWHRCHDLFCQAVTSRLCI